MTNINDSSDLPVSHTRYTLDVHRAVEQEEVIKELNILVKKLENGKGIGKKKELLKIPQISSYELYSYLKQYLWHQDLALTKVSHAFYSHMEKIRHYLENKYDYKEDKIDDSWHIGRQDDKEEEADVILQIGSTGIGKSEVMRELKEILKVPYVHATAEQFSTAGYVGRDVEELLEDAITQAEEMGDEKLAEFAIIDIDEIDKIITEGVSSGRDIGGESVQEALLKLLDKGEVTVNFQKDKSRKREPKKISTKNMFFVLSGAFDGDGQSKSLEQIAQDRLYPKAEMGFEKKVEKNELTLQGRKDIISKITNEDLSIYKHKGMIRQLQSRISTVVVYTPYTAEELSDIFEGPKKSMMQQTQWAFKRWGIDLDYTKDAIKLIGEKAEKLNTGARGLKSVISTFKDRYGFILSNMDAEQLTITKEIIEDPEKMLEPVVTQELEQRFLEAYSDKSNRVKPAKRNKYFFERFAEKIIETNTECYQKMKDRLQEENTQEHYIKVLEEIENI